MSDFTIGHVTDQKEGPMDGVYAETRNTLSIYTGDLEDTLDCLGLTWEELKASPVMLKALNKASTEIREREGC